MSNMQPHEVALAREAARPRNSRTPNPSPRPLDADHVDHGLRYSEQLKVQVLTLLNLSFTVQQVHHMLNIPERAIRRWRKIAIDRGWEEHSQDPMGRRILQHFVATSKSTGRPKEVTNEDEERILEIVRKDRAGREKSSDVLGYEVGWSSATVLRILHKHGFANVKPTRKPGLTVEQQERRLAFALEHRDWSMEDWKNVIWSDETSVILGQRRGTVRLWRGAKEIYEKSVVRNRWKGFTEFMFWGCFTYDAIGPCHIYGVETAVMKKDADEKIVEMNAEIEPHLRTEWELATAMRRTNLRRRPGGKAPMWRFNKANGKLVRESKGGVDWYRYMNEVLVPKLLPFAQICKQRRPNTVVQEDGAPAHSHRGLRRVYELFNVLKMLWPGNSPDLNAIEKAWFWLKRAITVRGGPFTRVKMEQVWYKRWAQLPLTMVQKWIKAIPRHIEEIIRLKGGNNYREGRELFKRDYKKLRKVGQLPPHSFLDPWEDLE